MKIFPLKREKANWITSLKQPRLLLPLMTSLNWSIPDQFSFYLPLVREVKTQALLCLQELLALSGFTCSVTYKYIVYIIQVQCMSNVCIARLRFYCISLPSHHITRWSKYIFTISAILFFSSFNNIIIYSRSCLGSRVHLFQWSIHKRALCG